MLATALTTTKYPFFDLNEMIHDVDLPFRKCQPLRPVKAGHSIPGFNLRSGFGNWQHFFNGAEIHGPIQVRQFLSKPLVISFYSPQWQQHGLDQLNQLNALQAEIKANGGNLLIVTAEKEAALEKLAWDNSLSLNFYFDAEHELAQSLRIYSVNDPIWDRFSGIDENVPLAATYVIDVNKQVIYADHGLDLEQDISGRDIISAVYNANLGDILKRSA